jgi:hypothetical protein
MRFRKLRIAFSATCLVACVLLVALWVRSYWIVDAPHLKLSGYILCRVTSFRGSIFFKVDKVMALNEFPSRDEVRSAANVDWPRWGWWTPTIQQYANGRPIPKHFPWFSCTAFKTFFSLKTPFWFWSIMCGTIAGLPWVRQWHLRFSLRTLLIATTLVAVMLGLIVAVL